MARIPSATVIVGVLFGAGLAMAHDSAETCAAGADCQVGGRMDSDITATSMLQQVTITREVTQEMGKAQVELAETEKTEAEYETENAALKREIERLTRENAALKRTPKNKHSVANSHDQSTVPEYDDPVQLTAAATANDDGYTHANFNDPLPLYVTTGAATTIYTVLQSPYSWWNLWKWTVDESTQWTLACKCAEGYRMISSIHVLADELGQATGIYIACGERGGIQYCEPDSPDPREIVPSSERFIAFKILEDQGKIYMFRVKNKGENKRCSLTIGAQLDVNSDACESWGDASSVNTIGARWQDSYEVLSDGTAYILKYGAQWVVDRHYRHIYKISPDAGHNLTLAEQHELGPPDVDIFNMSCGGGLAGMSSGMALDEAAGVMLISDNPCSRIIWWNYLTGEKGLAMKTGRDKPAVAGMDLLEGFNNEMGPQKLFITANGDLYVRDPPTRGRVVKFPAAAPACPCCDTCLPEDDHSQ